MKVNKRKVKMIRARIKKAEFSLFAFCLLVFPLTLCHPRYSFARTPTWNGWDFDIIKIDREPQTIVVFVKNTSRVAEKMGRVRVNCVIDGREVESHYLDVKKGEVSAARFFLPDITGTHSVIFQVWGGWFFAWKFDESSPIQINFGVAITPPSGPFEITTRESGPYTIYSCKFSPNEVNRMADDWNIADYYARRITWRIVSDKFNMSKEILIALAVTIKATADNLHYQSKNNRNCILVYELNFDNRAVPVVQTLQAVQSAVDAMKVVFDAGRLLWHPVSMRGFFR